MLTTNPSVLIYLHSESIVTTTGRGCVSPPGLNANLYGSISLYCILGHVWPLHPSSLTRGRPLSPTAPKNGIGRCALTSVEPLSPMAPSDAQAAASYGCSAVLSY